MDDKIGMKEYQYHIFSPYRFTHWEHTWITSMGW